MGIETLVAAIWAAGSYIGSIAAGTGTALVGGSGAAIGTASAVGGVVGGVAAVGGAAYGAYAGYSALTGAMGGSGQQQIGYDGSGAEARAKQAEAVAIEEAKVQAREKIRKQTKTIFTSGLGVLGTQENAKETKTKLGG